jgi:DNA-nicking Smr family endonuclease
VRSLSPDEAALWQRVTATIRPLSRIVDESAPQSEEPQVKATVSTGVRRPAQAPARPAGPGQTLDGSWDRRLGKGAIDPDRTIDLHGHTLDRAWAAIDRGLEQAINRGERVVLLITGHARAGEPPVQRGRIRAAVHDWLAASRHASEIAAVRGAHRRHGGGGSLYLILRRR